MAIDNCPGCSGRIMHGVCSMCGFAAPSDCVVAHEQKLPFEENRIMPPLTQSNLLHTETVPGYRIPLRGRLKLHQNPGRSISSNLARVAILVRVAAYVLLGLLAVPAGRMIGAGITYQLNAERRAREAQGEMELAESRAQDKLKYEAESKRIKEDYAKLQAYLVTLQERYAKAVENADTQAAREVMIELREFDRILGLGLFEQEKAEAHRAEIVARYQSKLDQLYAEYETAIQAGDQAAADRALSEAATLVRMSREIK